MRTKHINAWKYLKGTDIDMNLTINIKINLKKAGLTTSGINKDHNLVEIIEIPKHKWFVGVQFHPEFKSTVDNPHHFFLVLLKHA